MARPREFDVDRALNAALDVFWAKGYEAASMHDLMGAMGISKSSLYDTFGSKHELFIQAIDHYATTHTEAYEKALVTAPSGRRAIEESIWRIVDEATSGEPYQGCFAMNCAVEVCASDDTAADRVRKAFERYQRNYEIVVRKAQDAGEIGRDKDARALARFLTSSAHGLHAMAKANPDRAVLEDVARTVLAALD